MNKNQIIGILVVALVFIIPLFFMKMQNVNQQAASLKSNTKAELVKQTEVSVQTDTLSSSQATISEISKTGKPITLIGNLEIMHYDDFDNPENSIFEYYLVTIEGIKYRLYANNEEELVPNTKIEVSGKIINQTIVGQTKTLSKIEEDSQNLKTIPGGPTVTPYRTAVFLINFVDQVYPFTPVQAQNYIFNGNFSNLIKESSYQRRNVVGDVYGWIQIPTNIISNQCTGVHLNTPEVLNYINTHNIPLGNYNHIVFLNSCNFNQFGGFSSIGLGMAVVNGITYQLSVATIIAPDVGTNTFLSNSVNSNQLPPSFPWTNLDYILTHELGHSFGLNHANGFDCGSQSIIQPCKHIEYGNDFDPMGTGRYTFHYNGFAKEGLGWLKPSEILNITSTGTYTINNLETQGGYKFAKIRNTALPSNIFPQIQYFVEYRKGIGFDSSLNSPLISSNQGGLFINHYRELWFYGGARLIDALPTPSFWPLDIKKTTLNQPNIFKDPYRGITIGPVLSSTNSSITFDVTINPNVPPCTHNNPVVTIPSSGYEYELSDPNPEINILVSNIDAIKCGPSTLFVIELVFPSNIVNSQPSPYYVSVKPHEESITADVPISINPSSPLGTYNFQINVYNSTFPNFSTTKTSTIEISP